jgi:hypothetical protein
MKNKIFIAFIIAGSCICSLSNAANLDAENIVFSKSRIASSEASKLKIGAFHQYAKFLPEVHVGDGTRSGILSIEENLDATDDTPENLPKEESKS